jgi:hypothetical protein
MSEKTKLPISVQLLGVTAVLVFSFSAVSTIAFIEAIIHQWGVIDPDSRTWEGFYYPIFLWPVFYALLCVVSAIMFMMLVFASRTFVLKASLIYIAAMLAVLACLIYVRLPEGGINGFRLAATSTQIYLYVHVLYAIWLIGLAKVLLPPRFINLIVRNR